MQPEEVSAFEARPQEMQAVDYRQGLSVNMAAFDDEGEAGEEQALPVDIHHSNHMSNIMRLKLDDDHALEQKSESEAINSGLRGGSTSEISGITEQDEEAMSNQKLRNVISGREEKQRIKHGAARDEDQRKRVGDDVELVMEDDDSESVDAPLSQRELDQLIFQGVHEELGSQGPPSGDLDDSQPAAHSARVAKRTEESVKQSQSGSASHIFGKAAADNIHDDYSSLNTHL